MSGADARAGADPQTAPPIEGVDNFVPMVMGGLESVATKHPAIQESHTPETLQLTRTILRISGDAN
jgi:hypothetical protein